MKNTDYIAHVTGASRFVDDKAAPADMLYAAVFSSPIAHGRVIRLDTAAAERLAGVHAILTARDIPGENQIGGSKDELLLADDEVHFVGQPLALVIAESEDAARAARGAIDAEFHRLPAIFEPRAAQREGRLIIPSRTVTLGDVEATWRSCDVVVEGRAETGGQEHLYLETQRTIAYPAEHGGVRVEVSTQSPMKVQAAIASVLKLSMHQVEVDVGRLGGGFGGKIEQSRAWAALAALACQRQGRPVKLLLRRDEDMRLTGKRHPYSSDFKLGLDKTGKILAYEVTFFQDAGAAADSSPTVAAVTLFGLSGCYYIPNLRATLHSCRTNSVPNTACRGFGQSEGMFVLEAAIVKAAAVMGVEPEVVQAASLLRDGDALHYGPKVVSSSARRCWRDVTDKYELARARQRVAQFNAEHVWHKKGLSLTPVRYGISFDPPALNQASALLHVYVDGSVSLTTGAVEMGQGVSMKLRQVVARVLSLGIDRIEVRGPNTTRIANSSPTASFSADLNGQAARIACEALLGRLKALLARELSLEGPDEVELRDEVVYARGQATEDSWEGLVKRACGERLSLSEQAHYRTSDDPSSTDAPAENDPFLYYVYGAALTEVSVDCLRGVYEVDTVKVIHDVGMSLNPQIDRGQVEGAIVHGIGWLTTEELIYDPDDGSLRSDDVDTYQVPTIRTAPGELEVRFLEGSENPAGIFRSKGVGDAPLIYGFGAYFAALAAMRAFNSDGELPLSAPLTPERVLRFLYESPESR